MTTYTTGKSKVRHNDNVHDRYVKVRHNDNVHDR